jgi:hypothetical protein
MNRALASLASLGMTLVACQRPAPSTSTVVAAPTTTATTGSTAARDAGSTPPAPDFAQNDTPSPSPDPATIRRFGEVEWACDLDRGVFRRASGGAWIKQDDGERLPRRSAEGGAQSLVTTEPDLKTGAYEAACFFLDAERAWVLLYEEQPPLHLRVFRTTDGGARWSSSPLPGDHYAYTGAGAPRGRVRFSDAARGAVETVDLPGHVNGHEETRFSFDGGATWTKAREVKKCHDPVNRCKKG